MKKYDLFLPWLLVCIASVGCLFISNIANVQPCNLCWYQRSFLFPLVIILGIAAFRNAYRIILYVLPLAGLGLLLSGYHFLMVAFFEGRGLCPDCTLKSTGQAPLFFPLLSFATFLTLTLLLIWVHIRHKHSKKL
jgi:disulfide bond formation protein DsbB